MMSFMRLPPYPVRRARKVLAVLLNELEFDYQSVVNWLAYEARDPAQIKAIQPVLLNLAEMVKHVQQFCREVNPTNLADIYARLAEDSRKVTTELQNEPLLHFHSRHVMARIIQLLTSTESELVKLIRKTPASNVDRFSAHISTPTDLLFQCQQALFPAERMIVVSGRRAGNGLALGVAFDVTGNASMGHVRADARKLAQALISMEASNTHLAAWFHSHPGSGPLCTRPSETDLKQHQDWLHDYSPFLLGGIFVQDHYLRFWGNAIEDGRIELDLLGSGVVQERGAEHVFRIIAG